MANGDTQTFDPISEARSRWPGLASVDPQELHAKLSDPSNFRAAFPEYAHVDDDTIKRNMAAFDPLKTGVGMEQRAQQQAATERRTQALGTAPNYAHRWVDLGHPGAVQPSPVPEAVRASTGALPALGAMGGGVLAAPGVVSTPAGAALGGAAGEQARLLANRALFGPEETSPISKVGLKSTGEQGLIAGGTELGMQALGGLTGGFQWRPRPLEAIQGGPVEAGTENIFRAAQPGAGAKAFDLRDNIEVAKGDLAEIYRKSPLERSGGIRRTDFRVRDFVKNADDYLSNLWNTGVKPQVRRWSSDVVSLQPMKQSMLEVASDPLNLEKVPSASRSIQREVSRIPDEETLGQLMDRRQKVNAFLRDYEKKSAQDQAAVGLTKPQVDALKAQDRTIDNIITSHLQERGEPGIQELSRRYGAISNIRDAMRNQMNSAEAYRLFDEVRAYANPLNWPTLHERIPLSFARPGQQLEKGLERISRAGVQPPPGPGPRFAPTAPSALARIPGRSYDVGLGQQAPGGPNTALPPRIGYESFQTGPLVARPRPPVDLGAQAPGGPITALPPRAGYASPTEAAGESLARVPGRTYQEAGAAGIRTPPPGYSTPGVVEGTGIERQLAAQLKRGDVSQQDIMEMAKRGEIAYDAPRRIFRAAQRGVKAPPPETAAQYRNRKNQ